MANTSDFTVSQGDMSILAIEKSAKTVSTLFNSNVLFALLGIFSNQKSDAIMGVGDPTTDTVLSGCDVPKAWIDEWEMMGQFQPQIEAIRQDDNTWLAFHDNVAGISLLVANNSQTFTITLGSSGQITAVTITNPNTYSGAAPTLQVVDSTGSAGFGAELEAVYSGSVNQGASGGTILSTTVNVKSQGLGYTTPSIIVNAGYSEGQKYARPVFKWAELVTNGQIYDNEIDGHMKLVQEASDDVKAGAATSLVTERLASKLASNATEVCKQFWTGYAADQTLTEWARPIGLLAAIDDGSDASGVSGGSGVYAGCDRNAAGGVNYWWRSIVDTSQHTFDLKGLVLDAHYKKGLAYKGSADNDVFIVDPAMFARFQSQAATYTTEVNLGDSGELREVGMQGFRKVALKYNNSYVISDFRCPVGTALRIDPKTIVVAFKKGQKFAPSKLYDQHGIQGSIRGYKFEVHTKVMPMVIAPSLCAKWTNLV